MIRLSSVLGEIGRIYAADLVRIGSDVRSTAFAAASVSDGLAVVRSAIESGALEQPAGRALEEQIRLTGPSSREYRDRVAQLRARCEAMQEPVVANARIDSEVRAGWLATGDAEQIRKSVLRLGGQPPGVRVRWARWVMKMNVRIQDLDREVRLKKETEADGSKDELEKQRERNRLSPRLAVLAWIAMLSLVGLLIWPPWSTNPNEIKAAQDIELMSRRIIPAGTKGIRLDAPCPLIDKSTGVSVAFRIGDQDIPTCLRETMITR